MKEPKLKTVTVQIGNSDNKLTQVDWSHFILEAKQICFDSLFCGTFHFTGGSPIEAEWQNYCMIMDVEEGDIERLKASLSKLAEKYSQDSIAVTVGETAFVRPEKKTETITKAYKSDVCADDGAKKKPQPRLNVYVCEYGCHTVTVDVDEGTTPMFIPCQRTSTKDRPIEKRYLGRDGKCIGEAKSSFYPKVGIPEDVKPTHEWYSNGSGLLRLRERTDKEPIYHQTGPITHV